MNFKKTLLGLGLLSCINLYATDSNSIKHYGFSALFGFVGETIVHKEYSTLDDFDKIAFGTLLGTAPGLFKELTDDKFSSSDLAYDVAGALTGAVFSNYINNNTSIFITHNNKEKSTKINLAYKF